MLFCDILFTSAFLMHSQVTYLDFSPWAEEIKADLQRLGFSSNHMPLGAKNTSKYFKALKKKSWELAKLL